MKLFSRHFLPTLFLLGTLPIVPAAAVQQQGLSTKQWIVKLADDDKQVRRRAAYALGQMGPAAAGAVPALTTAADDKNIEVGWYALQALGQIGPAAAAAVPEIIHILKTAEAFRNEIGYRPLRLNGFRALGRIRADSAEAISLLESTLADPDRHVVVAAAFALWQIDGRNACLEAIGGELSSQDDDVALAAAMVLLGIGKKAELATQPLVHALGHKGADVRRAASRALSEIGMSAAPSVTKALEDPDRFDPITVISTLGWINEKVRREVLHFPATALADFIEVSQGLQKQIVRGLVASLENPKPEVRRAAARALARLGPTVAPSLLKLLGSEPGQKRDAVILAFVEMDRYLPADIRNLAGVVKSKGASLELIIPLLTHSDVSVRRAAFRLFNALQYGAEAESAVGSLRRGLRDQDVPIRRYAVRSLERIQSKP
ncbi:MAG: HEAT repeat domain-containing protein [Pirellulales bacterium]